MDLSVSPFAFRMGHGGPNLFFFDQPCQWKQIHRERSLYIGFRSQKWVAYVQNAGVKRLIYTDIQWMYTIDIHTGIGPLVQSLRQHRIVGQEDPNSILLSLLWLFDCSSIMISVTLFNQSNLLKDELISFVIGYFVYQTLCAFLLVE